MALIAVGVTVNVNWSTAFIIRSTYQREDNDLKYFTFGFQKYDQIVRKRQTLTMTPKSSHTVNVKVMFVGRVYNMPSNVDSLNRIDCRINVLATF